MEKEQASVSRRSSAEMTQPKRRFTFREKSFLEHAFEADANWSDDRMHALASRLGVKKLKVYKWLFDRKKRAAREQELLTDLRLEHTDQSQ